MLRTMLKDARVNPVRNGMRNPSFEGVAGVTQWRGNRVVADALTSGTSRHGTKSGRITTQSTGTGNYTFEGLAGWEPTRGGWGAGSVYVGYATQPLWVRPYVLWYSTPVSFGLFQVPTTGWVRVDLLAEEHPEPTFLSSSAYFGFILYGDANALTAPVVGAQARVDAAIFSFDKDPGRANRNVLAPYFDATTPNMKSDVQAVAVGTSITPVA